MEQWKHIQGYEDSYMVSSYGRVKSIRFSEEKILKPSKNKDGYLLKVLYKKSKFKSFKVHRLVAMAFIPNPENKSQVNHKNGIKDDNRVENLEWVTCSENMKHAFKIGIAISTKGQAHGRRKLNNEQILRIRNDNRLHKEIAKDYNVNKSLIGLIKQGKIWKHI